MKNVIKNKVFNEIQKDGFEDKLMLLRSVERLPS
jgi:hypothetical protein